MHQNIEFEHIRTSRDRLGLLPPLKLFSGHQRSQAYRLQHLKSLTIEDAEALIAHSINMIMGSI